MRAILAAAALGLLLPGVAAAQLGAESVGVSVKAPAYAIVGLSPGQAVAGNMTVSVTPPAGMAPKTVSFSLRNAADVEIAGNPEYGAPWCFVGDGAGPGGCAVFDTKTVPNGAYTLLVGVDYGSGSERRSVAFTIANGAAPPPPPPAPTAKAPTVAKLCRVTVTATPPDSTGGWTAQFRNGSTLIGDPDAATPFTRTANLPSGAYSIAVTWTKSGLAIVSPAATGICP